MDRENRIKRLKYRSWHRGCKETDIILGNFADQRLLELSPELLEIYERFLDENDNDIWNWLTDKESASPQYRSLIEMLKAYGDIAFNV